MGARSGNGAILGSFEAYLLLRGMRTLFPRVERACRSAQRIAEALAGHPRILEVPYPGLPSHPGHAVATRQMSGGFGGMLGPEAPANAGSSGPTKMQELAGNGPPPSTAASPASTNQNWPPPALGARPAIAVQGGIR